jgi:cobalt-zinc-cadmium efflux system outer membrane protein
MFKLSFLVLLLFTGASSLAKNTERLCKLGSAKELFQRLKNNHPRIMENKASLKMLMRNIDVASERPNPQLNLQLTSGKVIEGDLEAGSLSFLHTVELGGKRGSRMNLAKSLSEKSRYQLKDINEDLFVDALLKSYRLRQVHELIPIYDEAIRALKKIYSIKNKRSSLSPEEQVGKETLSLALSDHKLKLSHLKAEMFNLSHHLALFMGDDCEIPKVALPQKGASGETFDLEKMLMSSIKSYSPLNTASKELELAKRGLDFEKSQVYPDLKIGPAFQRQRVNGEAFDTFGLQVSIGLPILSRNKGARLKSLEDIKRASLRYKNIEHEARHDLGIWVREYRFLQDSLKSIDSGGELKKKHQKIEKLFKRGIISTAMVIESHRQLLEFARTRNQYELRLTKALWNIYKIQGKVL